MLNKQTSKGLLREYIESAAVAVAIAIILRFFVIAAYKIPTSSMVPTLRPGDFIFAWKLPYSLKFITPSLPHRGDVIVFKYPEDDNLTFIKRVVGVPGDKIEIKQKKIILNDQIVEYEKIPTTDEKRFEDIISIDQHRVQKEKLGEKDYFVMFRHGDSDDAYGPLVVPDGHLFVLGDNRDSSDDSRYWGMVPLNNLEGRALMIWLSLDWENRIKHTSFPSIRFERIMSVIH